MLNKSFQVFFKGTGLFILILLFHFKINAQNFNETDGRNANTIAVESSQGESKKNTQQAINPGTGTSQSEVQIRESAKNLAIESSKKPKTLLPNQNNSTESPGTVSKDPSREASELAEIQSRGGKSEQQIQTNVTKARQTGEEIRSQALSQKSAATTDPKQIQLEAKLARKAEIKKQRDDYESMIKANFNRFQKIRYRQMHYNGMSFDYTAFNQLFTPIKKRK